MQPDTRRLLRTGLILSAIGAIAAVLIFTSFGGIVGHQGPHTNSGWLALIVAIGCLPIGLLTLLLASVKLLGDRRE